MFVHVKFTVQMWSFCLLTINNIITPCVKALFSDVHEPLFLVFSIGKRRLEKFSVTTSIILNVIVYIQLARHWTIWHFPATAVNISECRHAE